MVIFLGMQPLRKEYFITGHSRLILIIGKKCFPGKGGGGSN